MEAIVHTATRSTPAVRFDPQANVMEISGESYPENAFGFYAPLVAWTKQYMEQIIESAVLDLRLTYLNTSSTRCVLMLLDVLEDARRAGKDVSVRWYYHPDDDRSLETGEEFRDGLEIPFEIIASDQDAEIQRDE